MNIGHICLENPIITAPMAGVTSRAFREILKDMGAGLVTTEMISAKALVYQNKQSLHLLELEGEVSPIAVQLCGHEPDVLARAAKMAVDRGAAIIDLNCGCPAPKIVKNGDGSRLLERPALIEEMVRAVKHAVPVPVTVKIRRGWAAPEETGMAAALAGERGGADAITVHGRYGSQYYSGEADWDFIRRVKEAVRVPVIGNGDLFSGADCVRRLAESGCDGIMLGRGLMGNPWLVQEALLALAGKQSPAIPWAERFAVARRHLEREVVLQGEHTGILEMRKHLAWYIKGMPKASLFRQQINTGETLEQVKALLQDYEHYLFTKEGQTEED